MSYSEFEEWNPMEEDYKMDFSERKSFTEDFDELCLYVRNIPINITQDVFYNIMSDGGRHVKSVKLLENTVPNYLYTCGFVNFATHKDALSALNALNRMPPFRFNIVFANKRKESESKNRFTNHDVNITGTRRGGINKDMEGNILTSPNLKVVAAETGRTVLMKLPASPSNESSNSTNAFLNKTPVSQTPTASEYQPDCQIKLVSNPFYFCFYCKKEGAKLSCSNCKKPYCSSSCQAEDWACHIYLCKVAKGVSESLLESYKYINLVSNGNNYMSGNTSSDCENYIPENSAINTRRQCNEIQQLPHISNSLSSTNLHALKDNIQQKSVQNLKAHNFSDRRKPLIDSISHLNSLKAKQMPIEKIYLTAGHVEKIYVINVESPSKFWVQLDKFSSILLNLEKDLSCIEKSYIQNVHPNVFCCVQHCNKRFRGKILKEKSPSEVLVYLLDYGKILTVLKTNVFQLPDKFRLIPMQAICCKLVDEKLNFHWNEEDSKLFQFYTDKKHYKARVFKNIDETYEVSLINEDGITLYSILAEVKGTTLKAADNVVPSTDNAPPSIWSVLKSGTRLHLVLSFMADNFYWCYLAINKSDLQDVFHIGKLLENYSTEDITKCAEEGDFVAGYSLEYQQFYRCIILKRKHKSFLVRYIDYGNEEEITCLNVLTPELSQICCYCVKCEKPPSLSKNDFDQYINNNDAEIIVIKAERDTAELSFNCSKQYIMKCYPCFTSYPDISTEAVFMKSSSDMKYSNISPKHTTKSSICTINNSNAAIKEVTGSNVYMEKVMDSKILSMNVKYKVKIVYLKTVSEVFVQLDEKETEMNIMFSELNRYCNSKNNKYVPKIGEIICCKFSDGLWYRGLVKEKVNNKYNVLFVDYGNEDFVLPNDIQSLPDNFICPKYSICVSLSGVKIEVVSSCLLKKLLEQTWDMQVIDNKKSPIEVALFLKGIALTNMIEFENSKKQNKLALKYQKLPTKQKNEIKITHEDDKYLYLHQVKDFKALDAMIAKLNSLSYSNPNNPVVGNIYCGLYKDNSWYRVILQEITPDSYKVLFLDYGNYASISFKDLKEISDDLLALPVFCISVIVQNRADLDHLNLYDKYIVEVVGMKDDIQVIQFLDSPVTSIKLPNISSFKKQQLSDGLNDVLICNIENGICYSQLSSDESKVLNVFKVLQKSSRECKLPNYLNVGDVISALGSDGFWYRASILFNEKAPSYKVMFVDYGTTKFVNIKNIKYLPEELVNIPVFSIPMKIENIEDFSDNNIFTKSVCVKKINVRDDIYIVKIVTENDFNLPKISSIEKKMLPSNSTLKVNLCHYDEGDIFFVQLFSKEFEQMTKCLAEADNFKSLLEMPQVDDVICTKFTDGMWYRSCVQAIFVNTNSLKVLFFDFGNSETVTLENAKILPPELCLYPIFSVPIKFKRYEPVEEILKQDSCVLEVKVVGIDKDIQIIDVISNTEETPINTYEQFYFSSLKVVPLPINENFKVIFKNHFENYYIAIKHECDEIYKLASLIQNADIITMNHIPSINEVLLIKKDNFHYRGCIKEIDINKNAYKVYFIDLGVTEDLHNPEMYELSEICKSFPMFAMKVLVESVEPITLEQPYCVQYLKHSDGGIPVLKVYHHYMIDSIAHQTLPLNEKRSVIFYHRENDLLFLQDLLDADLITEVQTILSKYSVHSRMPYKPIVGELVIAMSQCDNCWYRGCVEGVLPSDMYKICFIDFGNSEIIQEQNLQIIPFELTKFPKFCIPVKFSDIKISDNIELEKMYSVVSETKMLNNIQIIHLALNENIKNNEAITDEKIATCNGGKNQEFKFTMCKYVPFTSGEQEIAIYNVDENLNAFCAPFNQDNIVANLALTDAITEYCSSKAISFATGSEPEIGDMVLAKFSGDEQWYRAVVTGISDDISSYNVHFTDYGNSECIDISCLKKMDSQFMSLDIQAHMCSLKGFTILKENLLKVYEELKKFTIFESSKSLEADVQKIGDDITISVPSITAHLVKENLAVVSI